MSATATKTVLLLELPDAVDHVPGCRELKQAIYICILMLCSGVLSQTADTTVKVCSVLLLNAMGWQSR
jgi:hypothetical protein